MSAPSPTKPTVLFVCVHNAGRSQMAAGYLAAMSGGSIDVRSAGSEPAESLNPVAVEAMAEEGIDITAAVPTILRTEQVRASDVVITMGCGDTCPVFPGKRYEDWDLDDPAGQPLRTCAGSATTSRPASPDCSRICRAGRTARKPGRDRPVPPITGMVRPRGIMSAATCSGVGAIPNRR